MKLSILIIIFGINLTCFGQHHPEINKYVNFLSSQEKSSKEYILEQWEKCNMVILGERGYSELTQYELIWEVVSSDYFIKNVGSIFIEVGPVSIQNKLLKYLNTTYQNNKDREEELMNIYMSFNWPLWENSNLYFLLLKINQLNESLNQNQKIQVYTSNWMTPLFGSINNKEEFKEFTDQFWTRDRDSILVENIITKLDSIKKYSNRKKSLLIKNNMGAFLQHFDKTVLLKQDVSVWENSVGAMLNDHYHDVSVIMFNGMPRKKYDSKPIQAGKWDASFKVSKKNNVGFDFKESPFGKDSLDIWGYVKYNFNYADVFTGMVYYQPPENHILIHGFRNPIEKETVDQIYNQYKIYHEVFWGTIQTRDEFEKWLKYKEMPYPRFDFYTYQKYLSKWENN